MVMAQYFRELATPKRTGRMAAEKVAIGRPRNTALKDSRLKYRACTLGYAQSLQISSPTLLVGQTDFDLLSERGANLVKAAEQKVLNTGVAQITDGGALSKRTAGKYFVRSPVFNPGGQICGIEIFVVSIDELHKSYKLLLGDETWLRDAIDRSPFGMLIHCNFDVVYVNDTWLALMGGSSPSAGELQKLLGSGNAEEVSQTISSVDSNGMGLNLRLQTSAVNWNAKAAQVVYCFPDNTQSAIGSAAGSFIEKRHGHRRALRDKKIAPVTAANLGGFLHHIAQPVIVCDGWYPVHASKAAQSLLDKDNDGRFLSVESWFAQTDQMKVRDRLVKEAGNQVGSDQLTGDGEAGYEHLLRVKVSLRGQVFFAQISNIQLDAQRYGIISLQPVVIDPDQQDLTIAKLRDYVSSAGDFVWEMDAEQRLTYVSVELKEFLGIETSRLLNVSLDELLTEHVHEEDVAEWKVLIADLRKHLPFRNREYKWVHQDGDRRVIRLSGVPVFDAENRFSGYRGVGLDYTSQHHSASIVAYHASHDSLTGLVNRREFEVRCDEAVVRSGSENQALCFIDLDNFKRVNDSAGHLAGDELLRQLSQLFTGFVRKSDVLARLGGDEFGLLLYDVGLSEALRLATHLCAEVDSFLFEWEGRTFSVGASIGLVMVDARWQTRSALFGAADAACYRAKSEGRNRVAVFSEPLSDQSHKQSEQDEFVREAIVGQKIKLAMQQITSPAESTSAESGLASRIEILLRMLSEDGEILLPGAILPVAERAGLSPALDRAVVDATLEWLEDQPHVTDTLSLCCIHLSRASVADKEFLSYLLTAVEKTSIDTSILCFEISESAVSASLGNISLFMEKLGKLGCQFAMYDFSGGINAFSCLKKLPVSYVKINSTLVKAILEDPVHYAMVKSINDVAQTLGKQTIAGSVESEAVLLKLHELGVSLVQGYHISKPEIIDF